MNAHSLKTYLARFDIPLIEHVSIPLRFGLRISADFAAASPVIAVFQQQPARVFAQEYISPLLGLRAYQARNLGNIANLPHEYWDEFIRLAANLYRCYLESDALMIELESLHVVNGRIAATNGAIRLDQNGRFRRDPALAEAEDEILHDGGLAYIPLKGQIGVLASGAGLAMAAMDLIAHYSENTMRAANFLDVGSDLRTEKLAYALDLIRSGTQARAILITLVAGNQCIQVAHTLIELAARSAIPGIAYLSGIDSERARVVIEGAQQPMLISAGTLREAVRRTIHAAGGALAHAQGSG